MPHSTRHTAVKRDRGESVSEEKKEEGSLPLGDVLGKLMSNPEALKGVMSMLGSLSTAPTPPKSPVQDAPSSTVSPPAGDAAPALLATLSPLLAKGNGEARENDSPLGRRNCLLSALKPYLSVGRCEAIDAIVRLGDVADLLKHVK